MADIRCPMCGHHNPEGTLNCSKCDARLVPMGSIGQNARPVEEPRSQEQDDLSSLLNDIVDEGAAQNTGPLDSEILGWLDDDQPERKGDLPEAGEEAPTTVPVEDRLSSLLDDIDIPLDDQMISDWLNEEPDEEAVDDSENEDWLEMVSDDLGESEADDEEQVPDWMQETVTDVSGYLEEETVAVSEESPSPELPDWIVDAPRAVTGELDGTVLEEEAEALPGWFTQELEEETTTEEPTSVSAEQPSPELPDWIVDAPRAVTGELDESVLDQESEELPVWFTQELDEDVVAEESSTTGDLSGRVSTGSLPWMEGVSDDEDKPKQKPKQQETSAAKPKKQVFSTSELDKAAVEEPSRDALRPDDKLPPSSGMLDEKRVQTGQLPWMEGVSDAEEDDTFDLPVSKPLDEQSERKRQRSSGLLRKVTTSMLPWVSGVSDEETKPEEEKPSPRHSTILERFSGLLGRKEPEPAPEKAPEPEVMPEVGQLQETAEAIEEVLETSPELEIDFDSDMETLFEEQTLEPDSLFEDELPAPDSLFEAELSEPEDVLFEEPETVAVDFLEEETLIEEETGPISVEELIHEEKVQSIAPPPKERYEDALPEEEEAESWTEFLESKELAKDSDELPEWFAQTTDEKTSSGLLKEIGADENPTPVPVEEPEEETPKKKGGLTLGFLKGIRRRTDENLAAKQAEESNEEELFTEDEGGDDWDINHLLRDSQPLPDASLSEEDASHQIAREDWVIEHEDSEAEAEVPVRLIETLAQEDDVTEEEESPEAEEQPRKSLVERTADLAGSTGELDGAPLPPEDEALIGFAGTSELPAWMVKGKKKTPEPIEGQEPESDEAESAEEEETVMTAGLPEWMNTGRLPEPEDLPFEVDDTLMESIDEAMPTSELPSWLEEAEDKSVQPVEAVEAMEPSADEQEPEEDVDLETFFESSQFSEESEASIEELMDEFFESSDTVTAVEEDETEETVFEDLFEEEEPTDITEALAEAGLPKFMDDGVDMGEEESEEDEYEEGEIDLLSISQHLPKFMHDNMDMVSAEEENEITTSEEIVSEEEDLVSTAALPDWMEDEAGEPVESEDIEALFEEPVEEEGTAILPDWMDDITQEEELEDTKPGTSALEEWMNDPSSTHGLTGMLLDELDTGTLPPLEEKPGAVLPDWMSELPDEDAGEEAPLPDLMAEEETEDEAAALPAWMEEVSDEPTEMEEPVADLFMETETEEDTAILPEWMEESAEEEEAEETKPGTSALEDWMNDPSSTHGLTGMLLDELDTGTLPPLEEEPADTTAVLPDWMSELPDESAEVEEEPASDFFMEEDADTYTAVLPDWMEEVAEEEELEETKTGTSALEDWMNDPSSTHGLTGMMLDELDTGTLPPLEEEPAETTAVLPDWMAELPDEAAEDEALPDMFLEEEAVDDTAVLPDWMEELDEQDTLEEPETGKKPATSALEDWVADPSATHGLTGMLLDELDTGTLPPLEGFEEEEPESLAGFDAELPDWMSDPEASHGQTGDLLDRLETGTLSIQDEFEPDEAEESEDIPDWLSEMEIESFEPGLEEPKASAEDIAATTPLGDIAATHELPDWMSEMTIEGEEEEYIEEELPVGLDEFITSDEDLPDWMDEVAASEPKEPEEEGEFTSAFKTGAPVMQQDKTAVLPDWVDDMESVHGHTGMLIDNLETEETKALKTPGADAGLPDWLSEYTEEGGEPATASQADIEAWLADQEQEEEPAVVDDGLEPVISTDTGELNQWISENGISPDGEPGDDFELEDVVNIDVQKDLPEWVLDLEPDETAPLAPEAVVTGTAALPEWLVSEDDLEIDMTREEIPPMDSGMFDFLEEDKGQESTSISLGEDYGDEAQEDLDDDSFDLSSFSDNLAKDSLFGKPSDEEGEEVTPDDLFQATGGRDFASEDLSDGGEEVSPFDIHALEGVEENYTPDMDLGQQTAWLEEYIEPEEVVPEGEESASPFSISLEEVKVAEDEGVSIADELPEWVDELETLEEVDEDIWDKPLAAMAAISTSVQSAFDQEQPDLDHERANIQLMERILLSEKGNVQVSRPRRRTRELSLRLMLTLLLTVAVFAGLFTMVQPLPNFVTNVPVSVVQFNDQINYFTTNLIDQPVLVVFDYQPAYHEELAVYAELPLKTLMKNDARIFTFSTVAEGPALSQKMLFDTVIHNGLQYNTQSQAVSLGYLPGGSSAIRDFSTQLRSTVHGLDVGSSGTYIWDLAGTKDVSNIDDFGMVIVLTDDLDKARLWIEQATLYLPQTTPLMMITSSRISPMLKPYLLSSQLDGLIGSTIDTAAYGTLSNQDGAYRYYWRAYQLGIYLMVFAVIAGAVLQILRQLNQALKRGNV